MAICISDITPGISLQRSILESEHKRYFERFQNIWTVFECSQMIISDWAQVIQSVLGVILHTCPLFHVSSALLVCKKKKKIEFDGMERKQIIEKLQLRGKQIVLLPFVRVSEEIIQTDGKMNDPSAEVTCWLAFFSAISLFTNHYPWHTLLFYPSIKMREGRKRAREKERERWTHLVTCSSIS